MIVGVVVRDYLRVHNGRHGHDEQADVDLNPGIWLVYPKTQVSKCMYGSGSMYGSWEPTHRYGSQYIG
jgi:hypothetical protein